MPVIVQKNTKKEFASGLWKDLKKYRVIYLMTIPLLVYYILFRYVPMYGTVIAFQDYRLTRGISGSKWIGLENFERFFNSFYFGRLLRNTLYLSVQSILFSFPAAIILALLFNELRVPKFQKLVQTVSYLPHFVSVIVICSILRSFTATNGVFNDIRSIFGMSRENLLLRPDLFRPIYLLQGIWQSVGWNSIIYLAALAGVDVQLYEAARLDGANRFQQMLHVTIPGILPTIITMLILRIGRVMNVGYETVMLLYNEVIYETADIISTYVYRTGLEKGEYDFSTAVDLFNSVINCILLVSVNAISRNLNETSLW